MAHNSNERIIYQGDISECIKYLPFARKKSIQLLEITKNLNIQNNFKTYFVNDNFSFNVKINTYKDRFNRDLSERIITLKTNEVCNNYINGILRNCQNVFVGNQYVLNEYYPKTATTTFPREWRNLKSFSKDISENIKDIGYNFGGKSQYAHIKSQNYSGVMRYAIQHLLGTGRTIGFNNSFQETDGLIFEHVNYSNKIVSSVMKYYLDDYSFRLIKVNKDGIYLRNALNCIPTVIESNSPINYDPVYGDKFYSILSQSRFDIPNTLSTSFNSGVYKIDIDLSDFYNKTQFYNSCGWLFPYKEDYLSQTTTEKGIEETRIYGILNTCYSGNISYLYGIKLTQTKIIFDSSFKTTSAYLDNPLYNGRDFYIEYPSATLHKLKEGYMCDANVVETWLNSNSGFYIPDLPNDMIKPKELTSTIENATLDYAPLHVYRGNNNALNLVITTKLIMSNSLSSIEKTIINNNFSKDIVTTSVTPLNLTVSPTSFFISPSFNFAPVISSGSSTSTVDGNTITTGSITIGNVNNYYCLIPFYEREGLVYLPNTDIIVANYTVTNGSLTSLTTNSYTKNEYFDFSNNNMTLPYTKNIFTSIIKPNIFNNNSFEFNFVKDLFSSKYGYFCYGNENIVIDNSYPTSTLPFLNFIGKP